MVETAILSTSSSALKARDDFLRAEACAMRSEVRVLCSVAAASRSVVVLEEWVAEAELGNTLCPVVVEGAAWERGM